MKKNRECENLLRRSNIFQSIVTSIREAVITLDPDRRISYFSPRAENLTGYRAADVQGKPCHEVLGTRHCREDCVGERCLSQKEEIVCEDLIRCHKGVMCPVTRRTVPLVSNTDGGEIQGLLVILEDRRAFRVDDSDMEHFLGIVGNSDVMLRLIEQVKLFAPHEETVLIQGESGTGKERIARALHTLGERSSMPYVAVNCAALPSNLLESEFFGHVRGAFTGALRDRAGAVETARGGTLFLDEIGEMPVELQAKMLRFLQDKTFSRVGESGQRTSDVRIVAATNRDLKSAISGGSFREDLFFRLNVLPLRVPALRERPTDIPLLMQHFLEIADRGRHHKRYFSREVTERFLRYSWPGNVRELQNVIKYMAITSPLSSLHVGSIPADTLAAMSPQGPVMDGKRQETVQLPGEEEEAFRIRDALVQAGGNRGRAAAALGLHRTTLHRKMIRYGIRPFN